MNLREQTPVGKYTKKVELQSLTGERGGTGEKLRRFAMYAQPWAAVQPNFGSSSAQGPIPGASQSYVVCLTWSPSLWQTIKATDRVCWTVGTQTRTLDIKVITNWNEANVEIRLQCVEVQA